MGAIDKLLERRCAVHGAACAEGGAWWWSGEEEKREREVGTGWRRVNKTALRQALRPAAGCSDCGQEISAAHSLRERRRPEGGRRSAGENTEAEGAVGGGQRGPHWAPEVPGTCRRSSDAWAHERSCAAHSWSPPRDHDRLKARGGNGGRGMMAEDWSLGGMSTESRARKRGARRVAVVALERYAMLVALAALLPCAAGGHQKPPGGHYKYATLSWQRVGDAGSRIVDITLRTAWSTEYTPFKDQAAGGVVQVGQLLRISGLGNPVLFFGDGEQSYEMVNSKVVAVDPVMKVWRGEAVVRHEYASVQTYRAYFGGCCRDPNVFNSRQGYFNVTTSVNLNATRSPYFAVLPRQYLRARLLDEMSNSFIVAAYESTLHPNQLAGGSPTARPFSWRFVDIVAADSPMMANDAKCCNRSANLAASRGMYLSNTTGRVWGAAEEGLFYMRVAVTNTVTSVYSEVDFELAVIPFNASMPEFTANFSQAILDLPAVTEIYGTYAYDFRIRFLAPGATNLHVRIEKSVMPLGATLDGTTTVINAGGYRAYQSALRWNVSADLVGWHVFCFQAYSNETVAEPGIVLVASRTHCVEFDATLDPAPIFTRCKLN